MPYYSIMENDVLEFGFDSWNPVTCPRGKFVPEVRVHLNTGAVEYLRAARDSQGKIILSPEETAEKILRSECYVQGITDNDTARRAAWVIKHPGTPNRKSAMTLDDNSRWRQIVR